MALPRNPAGDVYAAMRRIISGETAFSVSLADQSSRAEDWTRFTHALTILHIVRTKGHCNDIRDSD